MMACFVNAKRSRWTRIRNLIFTAKIPEEKANVSFTDVPQEITIVKPREFDVEAPEAPEEGDGANLPAPVEEPVYEPIPA
jgi:hypothetical protein